MGTLVCLKPGRSIEPWSLEAFDLNGEPGGTWSSEASTAPTGDRPHCCAPGGGQDPAHIPFLSNSCAERRGSFS
jgi:hypothetical protein